MKLTSILFRSSRQAQNENRVPFKAILPLELRDFVSSKVQKTNERGCLQEMSLLLTCLEENEFEDKKCVPQLKTLNQCFKIYSDNMSRSRIISEQSTPTPGNKTLTQKQATYLIRQYPTV